MRRLIRDYVDHNAANHPAATYLVAPETGLTMSFGALRSANKPPVILERDLGRAG